MTWVGAQFHAVKELVEDAKLAVIRAIGCEIEALSSGLNYCVSRN